MTNLKKDFGVYTNSESTGWDKKKYSSIYRFVKFLGKMFVISCDCVDLIPETKFNLF